MAKYINCNGELLLSDAPTIWADNRAFNYGDGIFETIRCNSSQPIFFSRHYQRIKYSLEQLKIALPRTYTEEYFRGQIYRLLQRNRIYQGARVRITLHRNSGGLYSPADNSVSFVISASALPSEEYALNTKGIKIDIYKDDKKTNNRFSSLKTCNSLFYVMAGVWKKENNLDDCLLINQKNKIIEGLSSNLFIVANKVLYTPAISAGCVAGTMRATIFDIASKMSLSLKETDGFTESNLVEADEVFLTNAIQGISNVSGFRNRRYYHRVSAQLTKELNERASQIIA